MGIKIPNPFGEYDHSKIQINDIWAVSNMDINKPKLKIKLTSNFLFIPNGRNDTFVKIHLTDINSISLSRKKLLFPLISGSILSPLVALAFYNDLLSPVLFITLFLTGVFLIYSGFQGSYALVIEGKTSFKKFIQDPVSELFAFLNFCRDFIRERKKEDKIYLYHIGDATQAKKRIKRLFFKSKIENHSSLTHFDSLEIIKIDPMKLSSPIQITTSSNGSYSIFTKEINPESMQSV